MGLVKSVFRKLRAGLKNLDCNIAITPLLSGPAQETLPLRIHLGLYFLAHGAAQEISFRQRIARQVLGNLLHLFLIGDNAKSFFENGLKLRMEIFNLLFAELARAIGRNIRHGAWAVERHQRNQVFKPVSPHLAYRIAHAGTFQLEHADCVALREHVVRRPIIQRNFCDIKIRPPQMNKLQGLVDNRKGFQSEKVEFYQPGFFHIFHVELRRRKRGTRIAVKRHQFFQRPVTDHKARRMG